MLRETFYICPWGKYLPNARVSNRFTVLQLLITVKLLVKLIIGNPPDVVGFNQILAHPPAISAGPNIL